MLIVLVSKTSSCCCKYVLLIRLFLLLPTKPTPQTSIREHANLKANCHSRSPLTQGGYKRNYFAWSVLSPRTYYSSGGGGKCVCFEEQGKELNHPNRRSQE